MNSENISGTVAKLAECRHLFRQEISTCRVNTNILNADILNVKRLLLENAEELTCYDALVDGVGQIPGYTYLRLSDAADAGARNICITPSALPEILTSVWADDVEVAVHIAAGATLDFYALSSTCMSLSPRSKLSIIGKGEGTSSILLPVGQEPHFLVDMAPASDLRSSVLRLNNVTVRDETISPGASVITIDNDVSQCNIEHVTFSTQSFVTYTLNARRYDMSYITTRTIGVVGNVDGMEFLVNNLDPAHPSFFDQFSHSADSVFSQITKFVVHSVDSSVMNVNISRFISDSINAIRYNLDVTSSSGLIENCVISNCIFYQMTLTANGSLRRNIIANNDVFDTLRCEGGKVDNNNINHNQANIFLKSTEAADDTVKDNVINGNNCLNLQIDTPLGQAAVSNNIITSNFSNGALGLRTGGGTSVGNNNVMNNIAQTYLVWMDSDLSFATLPLVSPGLNKVIP